MKASYHLRVIEHEIKWESSAKTYLVQCLERLIVAQSGCCDVLTTSEEVRAACLYMQTYHRLKINCVHVLKKEISRFIRRMLFQRKFKTILKSVSGSTSSLSLKLRNRTIRPPALPMMSEPLTCNISP
jgi:hypothetical protein